MSPANATRTMRPALVALAFLSSACSGNDLCHSLGQSGTMPLGRHTRLTATSGRSEVQLLTPVELLPSWSRPSDTDVNWDVGPAEEAMCCATQQAGQALAWCAPEQLACSGRWESEVKIYLLDAPYTERESMGSGESTFCFAAVQGGLIAAFWQRFWG